MAQKFANSRWVKDGYLDNRISGLVVGQMTFAALGTVDFCLAGELGGELAGKVFRFGNPHYLDDPQAAESLGDFMNPQLGTVSLISFDPHPLLDPHPYIEWFSQHQQHYRIELAAGDASVMTSNELDSIGHISERLHKELAPRVTVPET